MSGFMNLPFKKEDKYLYLDDIGNLRINLFANMFNYIDTDKLKKIYISFDPKQISNYNYKNFFNYIELTKQYRTQNCIETENKDMIEINKDNYRDFLEKYIKPKNVFTNNNVFNDIIKYSLKK